MYKLVPLYSNSVGSGYYKFKIHENLKDEKIQLYFGDIGIIMDTKEMKTFLSIIRIAQKEFITEDCKELKLCKSLQYNTGHIKIYLNVNKTILKGLEDLILGILFCIEYDTILFENHIEQF